MEGKEDADIIKSRNGVKKRATRILHTCVLYNMAWLLFFYYRPLTM